ncbi:hypothetical protein DFA_06401 [Cavenderia fasciculata]|uniref:Uncharacterized protein n=1 Tax=Cavenderia fasciculata TaxID=261658 RepID=F4PIW5_CACFS|nr:uncharacterized protein DFA_06401 [Cavenderia fasciculata]EGG24251.1 hypothetical protein DFA_06401 [Cavenderia fasciculata]|eukprot:XP_004362102.1 hypothetical protein DFA_06401 [Cavenderia fasciculata]
MSENEIRCRLASDVETEQKLQPGKALLIVSMDGYEFQSKDLLAISYNIDSRDTEFQAIEDYEPDALSSKEKKRQNEKTKESTTATASTTTTTNANQKNLSTILQGASSSSLAILFSEFMVIVLLLVYIIYNRTRSPSNLHLHHQPSIRYIQQNYGLVWQLNGLELSVTIRNYLESVAMSLDGHLLELTTSYIGPVFIENGIPDPNFEYLDLPLLHNLRLRTIPRDGSKNILEMTRGLPSLKRLQLENHVIDYFPPDFPYTKTIEEFDITTSFSWTHLKNLNSIYFPSLVGMGLPSDAKEPLPDGSAEDIVAVFVSYGIDTINYRNWKRLPDSLCSALAFDVSYPPAYKKIMFRSYVAKCFKCYNHQFTNLVFNLDQKYPMDCNVTVSSVRYMGTKTRIEGNNLLNSLIERDFFGIPLPLVTPGGVMTATVPNKVLEYDRTHPSLVEENVVIGNNTVTKFIATVKVPFTTINIDGGMVSSQLPYGLYIRVPLNYNHFIDHKILVSGTPCIKSTILYTNDNTLQCFAPLLITQSHQYLTFQISNIRNNAITYYNLTRSYPNINNTIGVNMDDILDTNYQNSSMITLNGIFSHDRDELPTKSIVLINDQECLVQSINFTTLSCTINLKNILLINNNNINLKQQLDLFVEIDGHSLSSSNIIFMIPPSNSNNNSNSSNNNSEEEQEQKENHITPLIIYLIVTTIGAIVLVSVIVFSIHKIQSHKQQQKKKKKPILLQLFKTSAQQHQS